MDKVDAVESGRQSETVVFAGGTVDRREMLHGQYSRYLLRDMNADAERLVAIAHTCSSEFKWLRRVEEPDRRHEVFEVAALMAMTAAQIVQDAGLRANANPEEREAVMAEADTWLSHMEPGGHLQQVRARLRRRWVLAREARALTRSK